MITATKKHNPKVCPHCMEEGHDNDALHCKYCGGALLATLLSDNEGQPSS